MVIGVTGGVGTGKSTVLDFLKNKYNAAIIMADDVAKDLMAAGNKTYYPIVEFFGDEILEDGPESEIDRKKLSAIVFSDKDKLEKLNSMTHPPVKIEIRELICKYRDEGYALIVIESAILIQAGYLDIIDQLWVVRSDYEVRVKRLADSRGYTREKTDSIISNQLKDDEMESIADFVIDNSGSREHTISQIEKYLSRFI